MANWSKLTPKKGNVVDRRKPGDMPGGYGMVRNATTRIGLAQTRTPKPKPNNIISTGRGGLGTGVKVLTKRKPIPRSVPMGRAK